MSFNAKWYRQAAAKDIAFKVIESLVTYAEAHPPWDEKYTDEMVTLVIDEIRHLQNQGESP